MLELLGIQLLALQQEIGVKVKHILELHLRFLKTGGVHVRQIIGDGSIDLEDSVFDLGQVG